jgi:hypothetical protein
MVMIFSDTGIVQPLRFMRQPCCYSWVQEITKCEVEYNIPTMFPGNQSSQSDGEMGGTHKHSIIIS